VPPTTLGHRLVRPLCVGSAVGAIVLWSLSLRPSLLPRSWFVQGAVSGICVALGIAIGAVLDRPARALVRRLGRDPEHRLPNWARLAVGTTSAAVLVAGTFGWHASQQAQRPLVLVDPQPAWAFVPMLLATAIVAALLLTIARTVVHATAWIDRRAARVMRASAARWVTAAIVTVVAVVALSFAGRWFAQWAEQNFGVLDTATPDDAEEPTSSTRSGGPGSLVDWDDLGFQGRGFVGTGPTAADIAEFTGAPALDPIRAYVGLRSADSLDERVELAVDELERTGAFERSVLVVVTPTGTGWVNPDAARSIEFMHGGDTAIVSVQYSFLPSWVAFLLDTESPPELGTALFGAVHEAWAARPADDRPTLVVYGESLGSFGGEAPFSADGVEPSIEEMTERADALVWVGPTRGNPVYGQVVDDRDPGSSSWRPVHEAVSSLRVAGPVEEIDAGDAGWERPRVLYLHHATDAIGTWQWSNIWSNPGWADDPPAADVLAEVRWVPLVSFVQESFDLMNGFSAAPGHGHDYRNALVDAWAAIVPPPGWAADDTARLRTVLDL
jgi:uncharacterized membrane protein